jgi:hypothetical protein
MASLALPGAYRTRRRRARARAAHASNGPQDRSYVHGDPRQGFGPPGRHLGTYQRQVLATTSKVDRFSTGKLSRRGEIRGQHACNNCSLFAKDARRR